MCKSDLDSTVIVCLEGHFNVYNFAIATRKFKAVCSAKLQDQLTECHLKRTFLFFTSFTMKLRLPLLLAVLSIVGFVVAQYENYYNNEDTSSDKDGSSFTDYLLALIVGLFFIEKFVKRKYNFTGSDNFVNLRP